MERVQELLLNTPWCTGHLPTVKNHPVNMSKVQRLRNSNLLKECCSQLFFQGFFWKVVVFPNLSVRNNCISAEQLFWLSLRNKHSELNKMINFSILYQLLEKSVKFVIHLYVANIYNSFLLASFLVLFCNLLLICLFLSHLCLFIAFYYLYKFPKAVLNHIF